MVAGRGAGYIAVLGMLALSGVTLATACDDSSNERLEPTVSSMPADATPYRWLRPDEVTRIASNFAFQDTETIGGLVTRFPEIMEPGILGIRCTDTQYAEGKWTLSCEFFDSRSVGSAATSIAELLTAEARGTPIPFRGTVQPARTENFVFGTRTYVVDDA